MGPGFVFTALILAFGVSLVFATLTTLVHSDKTAFARPRVMCLPPAARSAPLWLTAAFLAATWASNAQANDVSRSGDTTARLAQEATRASQEPQATADHNQQEAEMLARELAVARHDLELLLNLLNNVRDEAARVKQATEKGAAELRQSLRQEQDKAATLAQELAAARTKISAYESQTRQASDQATELRQAAEGGTADLKKSLQQERDRAGRLEQDLATAKREVEAQTALATKKGDEAAKLKQAAESDAELRKSLQQEHDKAAALAQDLSTAKAKIYAYDAQAREASDHAAGPKQVTESSAAELRKYLVQEWEREARLQLDLAAARREVETQTAVAAKARDEASRLKQVAESSPAELRNSLQQERDKTSRLERDLALERSAKDAPAALGVMTTALITLERQGVATTAGSVAADQLPAPEVRSTAQPNPKDAAEVARRVARASILLGEGDIGSARIVLERAAEMGNAQASFALAETYDPLVLPKWGTSGTRGDAKKARDLYAEAEAGGIKEAKARFDELRRWPQGGSAEPPRWRNHSMKRLPGLVRLPAARAWLDWYFVPAPPFAFGVGF
jgi:septal ring factor EnvC (AmiA/AmiB activator)